MSHSLHNYRNVSVLALHLSPSIYVLTTNDGTAREALSARGIDPQSVIGQTQKSDLDIASFMARASMKVVDERAKYTSAQVKEKLIAKKLPVAGPKIAQAQTDALNVGAMIGAGEDRLPVKPVVETDETPKAKSSTRNTTELKEPVFSDPLVNEKEEKNEPPAGASVQEGEAKVDATGDASIPGPDLAAPPTAAEVKAAKAEAKKKLEV